MADKNNIISINRSKIRAGLKKNRLSRVQVFADRLDDLYDQAEVLMNDIAAALPNDMMVGDLSKEKFLGYFECMLDSIDDTWIRFSPQFKLDEDDAG